MPEISRFYGIVVKMFFDDHSHLTFMLNTAASRLS